jgi:hypothetical protein
MIFDFEAARLEAMQWVCLPNLRWRRPEGGDDKGVYLEQLWERVTGER